MGGGGGQEVKALGREREQTTVDEVVERVGHGKGPAGRGGDAGTLEHAHDLERVEGISPGGLMHLREKRTRERRPELLVHGATH